MDDLKILQEILENQKEIKYLGYLLFIDYRTEEIDLELSASGISRKFKFKNITECLNKIVELLQRLKRLETFYLNRSK